jgi:protein-S-isoprenylcysteine O-methyltransferase Ste14
VLTFFIAGLLFICASSTSITWERTASRPETGLLIPSDYASDERLGLGHTQQRHAQHIEIGPPFLPWLDHLCRDFVRSRRLSEILAGLGVHGSALCSRHLLFSLLYKHDPKLIERRLQTKEKVSEQKRLVGLLKVLMVVAFSLPGLDYRFGWSRTYLGAVPQWLIVLSQALILGSLAFVLWVIKTNTFAASTIQVEAGQTVISTGPYSVVRHPMYLGGIVMLLATPLALGSYVSLSVFALVIPFYIFRLLNEEKVLRGDLVGYPEYCSRTRSRLIPFVW